MSIDALDLSPGLTRHVITPRGAFSLAASVRFLEGFTPLQRESGPAPTSATDMLRLAMTVEGSWEPVGVCTRQNPDGTVIVTHTDCADPEGVRDQVTRMLSLDVDASRLPAVADSDPRVGELVSSFPGLRPVLFASPYEAAAWAILSQRVRMSQGAAIRRAVCERFGATVEVDGRSMPTFPGPRVLRDWPGLPGLPDVKVERLRGLADAVLAGALKAAELRSMDPYTAVDHVQQIAGIGPFSAELIVIRGAGEPDLFPTQERRLRAAMSAAYGIDTDDTAAAAAVARSWAPFRSWVAFLLRARAAQGASHRTIATTTKELP